MIERLLTTNQNRLQTAGFAPVEQLAPELEYLQRVLPQNSIESRPLAALFAADGLAVMRANVGGGKDPIHSYTGTWEKMPVLATFHQIEHVTDGVEGLIAHGSENLMEEVACYTQHDRIISAGRKIDDPNSYSEQATAEAVRSMFIRIGLGNTAFCGRVLAGIHATTYNPKKMCQDVDPARGYLSTQKNIASTDMGGLATRNCARDSMRVVVEESYCKRSTGNWLPREILKRNLTITSVVDALRVVDAAGEDVRFAAKLAANASFVENYVYPNPDYDDPTMRSFSVGLLRHVASSVISGDMSCAVAYGHVENFATKGSF